MTLPLAVLPAEPIDLVQVPLSSVDFYGEDLVLHQQVPLSSVQFHGEDSAEFHGEDPVLHQQVPSSSIEFHVEDPVLHQPQLQPQIVSPIINKIGNEIESLSGNFSENEIERTTESAVNDQIESPVEIPIEKAIEELQVNSSDGRNAIQMDLQEAVLCTPESPEIDHLDVNNPKIKTIISKKENLKIFRDFEKNTEKQIESAGLSMKTIGDALREQSVGNLTKVLIKLREKLEEVEDFDRNVRGDEFAAVLTLGNLHHEIFSAVLYCALRCCAMLSCTVLYCTVLYCTVLCCAIWITQDSTAILLFVCSLHILNIIVHIIESLRSQPSISNMTLHGLNTDKSLYLSFTLS